MSVRVICADAIAGLRELPADSVHCVVTSPPYWGLRDYGTGTWEGGEAGCDHRGAPQQSASSTLRGNGHGGDKPLSPQLQAMAVPFRDLCGKCGARRVDQQIGLEPTPAAWAARLVEVFREVKRVLRPDGVCFVNLGDSYCSNAGGAPGDCIAGDGYERRNRGERGRSMAAGDLKPKDLVGQPWLLAFALRADGWWLRSEIIWSKLNPMPESVTDRPTKAHETVFLLTKSARYFYDAEAVREAQSENTHERFGKNGDRSCGTPKATTPGQGIKNNASMDAALRSMVLPHGRNLRSVWTIATEPFPEAHFATFPSELPRRCILAGTSAKGCCPACGAPWARVVENSYAPNVRRATCVAGRREASGQNGFDGAGMPRMDKRVETLGWRPSCACAAGEPVPATVLDPFGGSGTTGVVADELGRDAVLCELSPDYAAMAERRVAKARARRLLGPDAPRPDVLPGQLDLLATPHP